MSNFFVFGDKFNFTLINLEKVDSMSFKNISSGTMYNAVIKYSSGAVDEIEVMQNQITKLSEQINPAGK